MNYKNIKVDIENDFFPDGLEPIQIYLRFLKRKNNATLHLIEDYMGVPLDSNDKLLEIKNNILDVSGSLGRLPYQLLIVSDEDERL
ncbi:hypothetical protein ACQKNX_08190 [Lysinibacillus sp. NPDC093712]|uniref:hypothetical protein n=1 Tax=Lysinibacillus sp. NPDC093712 TaxID=3390579 RepID=UPI003D0326DF